MADFDIPLSTVQAAFPQFVDIIELGSGGQKIVYKATEADGTPRALKIIKRDSGSQDARIIREVDAARKLSSPCFAKIFDAQYLDIAGENYIFLLEEFIVGSPLSSYIQRGAQPLHFIKRVGEAILDGLTHTHAASLVHRDIKPGNIMVGDDGRIVLIDFGIARQLDALSVTSSFAIFGPMTVGYSAPEQINNEKRQISTRTDLFALGVVLYEMSTGINPFRETGRSDQDTLVRCLQYNPPPLSSLGFPQTFSSFVEICMQKQSHKRPPSPDMALQLFQSIDWEGIV